ncbi:MAG: class I SAM-dependent methyltransferase [Clostridia bacterium]|nr:class I SAM-dependent methyltransferase [Clostridia bacterium]
MDTFESLTNYYNTKDESLRLSTRHGSVEFLTTVRYVEKYLSENHRILEIGAATGKYSHYFAQKGYKVDAIELVQHNIDVFNSLTLPEEKVTVMQGNALDLSHIKDETYDITLLLGPMYHLYTVEEQLKALSEAIRVTKPKGKIFAAYCNTDMTVYQYCFKRNMVKYELDRGMIEAETFKLYSTPEEIFQMHRKEEVYKLTEQFDVTRLHYVGTDMLTRLIDETVDNMDDSTFDLYMKYHFFVCEREDMVGVTNHMLDILEKN